MHLYGSGILLVCTSMAMASFDFHFSGWLDKVVEYHKNKLFEDFRKVPVTQIKATIQPAPEGYVDSPAWDFESVRRLMFLIRQSETARPVRQALRRMLGNTRRMTFRESFKAFPSLTKDVPNDIYYDSYSSEMYGDVGEKEAFPDDKNQDVIMVSNPVEARLPSAMISISLLRNILEERAKAARYMSTTRQTIPWKPMTKTTTLATPSQNATKQEDGAVSTGKTEAHTDSTGNTGAPGTGTAANTTPA